MAFKDECELTIQDGLGITSVPGIKAAGIHAGFRKDPKRKDMALIVADEPCVAAGLFTTNIFCAAPVTVCRQNIADGRVKAIVINSGNANAATGEPGIETAKATCDIVAAALGCDAAEVLPCSTGVIGVPLPTTCFESGVPAAVALLDAGIDAGHDAARAIMTTDTVPKELALSYKCKGRGIHIAGMCKGSGMIMPNMATMIAVVCTDAALTPEAAKLAFKQAVDGSFNCVTVDSDTSTNDTSILLATGKAGGKVIDVDSKSFGCFCEALAIVCKELAKKIARDGEGASHMIEVRVTGAADDVDAQLCARTIANSPLVKTAIAGCDANWGRIAAAAGRSGAKFVQEKVDIDIAGIPVLRGGLPVHFSEEEALEHLKQKEVVLAIDLGAGDASACIWTCDFTHGYISINADYRS